jgi:hypothetical protein
LPKAHPLITSPPLPGTMSTEEIEEAKNVESLGEFFAAYREDGSAFVWFPEYDEEPEYADKIIPIIMTGLEEAPLEERKIIAAAKMLHITQTLAPDDHDLSFCRFYLDTTGVSTSAGVSHGIKGIEASRRKTTDMLVKFVEGVTSE